MENDLQRSDQFLTEDLLRCKDELYIYVVAIIGCCHVLRHDLVREQLILVRPDADVLQELFMWKLKAYVQCLFHCQKANSSLFLTYETLVIVELLRNVIPAGSKRIRPVWKLLRVVGDDKMQELFRYGSSGRSCHNAVIGMPCIASFELSGLRWTGPRHGFF
ncbi:hypothetical protein F5Y17DRAFT_25748 [Xylariaceae sp. FL0594]|nr:hypothetical protein F5Y17DRAFT_25748 [Xylariaceae sp. FL0594]